MKNSVRQFDATTLMNAKVPAVSPSFAFELLVQMSCSLSTIMNIVLTLQISKMVIETPSVTRQDFENCWFNSKTVYYLCCHFTAAASTLTTNTMIPNKQKPWKCEFL